MFRQHSTKCNQVLVLKNCVWPFQYFMFLLSGFFVISKELQREIEYRARLWQIPERPTFSWLKTNAWGPQEPFHKFWLNSIISIFGRLRILKYWSRILSPIKLQYVCCSPLNSTTNESVAQGLSPDWLSASPLLRELQSWVVLLV